MRSPIPTPSPVPSLHEAELGGHAYSHLPSNITSMIAAMKDSAAPQLQQFRRRNPVEPLSQSPPAPHNLAQRVAALREPGAPQLQTFRKYTRHQATPNPRQRSPSPSPQIRRSPSHPVHQREHSPSPAPNRAASLPRLPPHIVPDFDHQPYIPIAEPPLPASLQFEHFVPSQIAAPQPQYYPAQFADEGAVAPARLPFAWRVIETHYLGRMQIRCTNCGAWHWKNEQLAGKDKFGMCCLSGKVILEPLKPMPSDLLKLFKENNNFRKSIRAYNSAVAMASIGAKVDKSLHHRGPPVYKIRGALYHHIGSHLPPPPQNIDND